MPKVYAKTDQTGRVLELASSVFLKDPAGWVQIDEGDGDRYVHAQGNYLDKPLTGEDGTHRYILEESALRETTETEQAAEKASFPPEEPSREEQLNARLAAMQAQMDALLGVEE